MKILQFIVMAFLLLIISLSTNCQEVFTGKLKGKVIDKVTKQALPGATISVKNSQTGGITDTSGIFLIKNIPEGIYSLQISYIGYQEKTVNDVQITRNKTNYLEVELEEASTKINEVVVKSFKFENNRQAPISSYGFSREEISRNPGAQGDIFRAIGMLPGVSSSGGEYSAIAVRGQGTKDNLYTVDDIPVTEVSHLEGSPSGFGDPNGGRFSIFAPKVIDNAEFQGGGFSSQYGRKSASYLGLGIKEGNREDLKVDGQLDLMGFTVNYDGPSYMFKNTSIFASARYQNLEQVENIAGLKDLGLPKYSDFIFKSTSQLGSKNKLSVIAIYSPETFVRTTDNVKEDKKLNSLFVADRGSEKTVLGINLRTTVHKNGFMKNILYYTRTHEHGNYGTSYPQTDSALNLINPENITFEDKIRTIKYTETKLSLRSIHTIRFSNNSNLTTGLDVDRVDLSDYRKLSRTDTSFVFKSTDYRPDPAKYYTIIDPAYFNTDVSKNGYNASAYANYFFVIGNKLSINAGIRYDYSGFTNQHTFSPRLSGSLQLNETNSVNFATGIYYQDPLYTDIADQPESKKLKEEKVFQIILGYKKYYTPDLKLTVEGWYKNFDNMVVRPIDGQVEQNNSGDGYAYGIDINVTKRLVNKVHGQVGYSYMVSKRNDHDGMGEYNFDFSQPHQVNFLIGYKPNNHWVLSAKFRYSTGKPTDKYVVHNNIFNNPGYKRYSEEITSKNSNRLPDFISLDIRADYRFQIHRLNLTAFVDIVDILNRQNVNGESFNYISGKTYFDGISIFPTFGLKFQL